MFNGEDFITAKGVILSREHSGENFLYSTLFLEGEGIVSLTSKNFMGDSEPFSWGYFELQRKQRSARYFIYDTDIKDNMLDIRRSRESIMTAINWTKTLTRYLLPGHPDDELLTNLYWSMKLLAVPAVPAEAVNWRFLWLWLTEWGLAPELGAFHEQQGFRNDEVLLLAQAASSSPKEVTELFSGKLSTSIRSRMFHVASKLAVNFLNQI
ncbi:MAG: hypothetical protein IJS28_02905 [Synergistaceae bacterium]|nr:hypothetical protein [Synergistaceae bacterium]